MAHLLRTRSGSLRVAGVELLKKDKVSSAKKGYWEYILTAEKGGQRLILPGKQTMRRLAYKFLDHSMYVEDKTWSTHPRTSLHISIKSGVSLEDRAAFLAAVATHIKQ